MSRRLLLGQRLELVLDVSVLHLQRHGVVLVHVVPREHVVELGRVVVHVQRLLVGRRVLHVLVLNGLPEHAVRRRLRSRLVCGRRRYVVFKLSCGLVVRWRSDDVVHAVRSVNSVGHRWCHVAGYLHCVCSRLDVGSGRGRVHAARWAPVPRGLVHCPAEQLLLPASDSIDDVVRRGRQLRSASPWSVSCVGAQRY